MKEKNSHKERKLIANEVCLMDVMSLECQLSLHINKRGQRNKLLDGYNLSKT